MKAWAEAIVAPGGTTDMSCMDTAKKSSESGQKSNTAASVDSSGEQVEALCTAAVTHKAQHCKAQNTQQRMLSGVLR